MSIWKTSTPSKNILKIKIFFALLFFLKFCITFFFALSSAVLEWGEDDVWSATLNLPPGSYEFKFVVAAPDSSIWEGGANRTVDVPSPSTTGGGTYLMGCSWGNPESSLEPAGPEGVPTDSEDEAEISPEDAEGNISGADDDDSGTLSTEVGKMTIGKMTVESSTDGDASSEDGSVVQVGKMTFDNVQVRDDLVDTGIGAEEGFNDAEAMIPGEVVAEMASSDDDDLESPLQKVFTEFLKVSAYDNCFISPICRCLLFTIRIIDFGMTCLRNGFNFDYSSLFLFLSFLFRALG